MNALTAAEFKRNCDKQILNIPDDLMAQYRDREVVVMDKCVAVDEWGESLDTACQMCGRPGEEFPLKLASELFAGEQVSLPDTGIYTMVHPDSGTRFQWTICPLCMKKLRISGVSQAVAA